MTSLGDKVRVKPLEWRDITSPREDGPPERTGDIEASTMIGDYSVCVDEAAIDDAGDDWKWCAWAPYESLGHFADLDEAKAAAQADYKARILSALDLSPPVVEEGLSLPRVDGKIAPPVEIGYTNYRGEFAVRCIVPVSFWYGSTDWHPEPQWLVKAWDADKGAERDFAFKDFSPPASPSKPEEPAPVPIPEPQAVAWRYRYEETGEDNEMIWSDWIVVKWKPNRSVFSTKVEIEPLAPLSGGGKVEVTNGVVDAQWQWLCDKDDRSSPVEYPDMALVTRDELGEIIVAVLSTMGGKP